MAVLKPFQAVRYATSDLKKVVSPPYDQISSLMQEELYNRDPHNFIRLILGKTTDTDDSKSNRYSRAADTLSEWLKKGVLIEESEPGFFLYEQSFTLPTGESFTRLGVVGLMALQPLGHGVLPHEQTFAKPKADRLNLMKATKSNFEHIFFLYEDPTHFIRQTFANLRLCEPWMMVKDDLGARHILWKINDSTSVESIRKFFEPKTLLIADGHHRYETSLDYRREMESIWCDSSDDPPFNWRLGTFVNLDDPGLVILPTHRVVKSLSSSQIEALEKELPNYFEMEKVEGLSEMLQRMKEKNHSFGLADKKSFRLLTLKLSVDLKKEFPDVFPALRDLDVFVLHHIIIERILKLAHDRLDQLVSYVRWPEDVMKLLKDGSHQAAFFLNPVAAGQIKTVCESGEKMPHKSTDFYPKLWSGLLFYKMNF